MSRRPSTCGDVRTDLGGYVLSGLEPAEEATVAEHLLTCRACREEYGRLQDLPDLLGAVTQAPPAPPPALRERVLAAAKARRSARRQRRRVLQLVAAVVLGAVLGSAGLWLSDRGSVAPGSVAPEVRVDLTSGEAFAATGSLRMVPTVNGVTVELDLRDLPALQGDEVYEVWFAPAGGPPLGVGTFRPGPAGTAAITASAAGPIDRYASVWVTLEPDATDPAHDGPTVAAAPLPG